MSGAIQLELARIADALERANELAERRAAAEIGCDHRWSMGSAPGEQRCDVCGFRERIR